jgi:hypothetical protein
MSRRVLRMLGENGLPLKRDPKLVGLAIALWVGTSVVSFLEILTVRAIVLRFYSHFAATYGFYGRQALAAHALSSATLVIMGIVCIGVAIGCGEYHLNHFNKSESWRLFSRTIAAETAIAILALFV